MSNITPELRGGRVSDRPAEGELERIVIWSGEMKIQQENLPYKPITLKLQKRSEAEALIGIMDKVCHCRASVDREIGPSDITDDERDLAIEISNAFSTKVTI